MPVAQAKGKTSEPEFNIDLLITYAVEPADPERMVPNPERRRLQQARKAKQAQLGRAHVRQAAQQRDATATAKQAKEAALINLDP